MGPLFKGWFHSLTNLTLSLNRHVEAFTNKSLILNHQH